MNRLSSSPFALVVNVQGHIEKRVLRLGVQTPTQLEVISGVTKGDRAVATSVLLHSRRSGACAADDPAVPSIP